MLRLPDGTEFEGPVVDLRGVDADTPPGAVRGAIRAGCPTQLDRPTVHAPSPTRVHRHVCHLTPDVPVDRHAALAAVGAARGVETPHCAELSSVKQSLRDLSVPTVDDADLRAARRRAAAAGSETERLRERVATLRGRVEARRSDGGESRDDALAGAEASLSEATRELSEALSRSSTTRAVGSSRRSTVGPGRLTTVQTPSATLSRSPRSRHFVLPWSSTPTSSPLSAVPMRRPSGSTRRW